MRINLIFFLENIIKHINTHRFSSIGNCLLIISRACYHRHLDTKHVLRPCYHRHTETLQVLRAFCQHHLVS